MKKQPPAIANPSPWWLKPGLTKNERWPNILELNHGGLPKYITKPDACAAPEGDTIPIEPQGLGPPPAFQTTPK